MTSLSTSPGLYPNLPYDAVRDLAQISRIADSPSILLVRPGLGPRTLAELVALAKQKPGEITFGSGGPGSSAHLAMELLRLKTGFKVTHLPYKGAAPAGVAVMAGEAQLAFLVIPIAQAQIKAGTFNIWKGPLVDNHNNVKAPAGKTLGDFYEGPPPEPGQTKDDAYVQSNQMNWALSNIVGDIPQS